MLPVPANGDGKVAVVQVPTLTEVALYDKIVGKVHSAPRRVVRARQATRIVAGSTRCWRRWQLTSLALPTLARLTSTSQATRPAATSAPLTTRLTGGTELIDFTQRIATARTDASC